MQKAKGSVLISIGSILMIVSGILGILGGILLAVAGGWLLSSLSTIEGDLVEASDLVTLLSWGGTFLAILILVFAVLWLVFGIMSFKRRNDLQRSTFPLVIGIVFTALALLFFFWDVSFATACGLVSPLLILIGASLNKGQLKSQPPYPVYPQGQVPYPPYPNPYQPSYPPQADPQATPPPYPGQPGQAGPPAQVQPPSPPIED